MFYIYTTLRPPSSSPLPYTTLFRSAIRNLHAVGQLEPPVGRIPEDVADIRIFDHPQPQRPLRSARGPLFVPRRISRSEEHTSERQSHSDLVCRLLLEKKNTMSQPFP